MYSQNYISPDFIGNGTYCAATNECATGTHDCDSNADCSNTPGGFSCACRPGYSGDGITCRGKEKFCKNSQFTGCENFTYNIHCNIGDRGFLWIAVHLQTDWLKQVTGHNAS